MFRGVVRWGETHRDGGSVADAVRDVLRHVRFPLMSTDVLRVEVIPTGLVPKELLAEALAHHEAGGAEVCVGDGRWCCLICCVPGCVFETE